MAQAKHIGKLVLSLEDPTALIEPAILIVMAVFVGGVLISLYLPIFTLGAGVH